MRTIVAHIAMMIAVIVSASAWSEDACEICQGTGIQTTMTPVKITQSHTTQSATRMDSTTSEVERMEVTKTFCPKCECGKALCRESFQILNSLPGHLERQVVEEQRQVPGWKVRADTSQKQAAQANKELQDLRNSKADVRDQISKVETRIQNLGQELEKANAKQTELQEKLRNLNTQQESCKRLMDVVKRKLADYGEALPAPEKRTPPAFPLHVLTDVLSAASPALKKGSMPPPPPPSLTDIKPPAPEAPAATGARRGVKTYILNDGRKLSVKIAMENGEDVMLKCDDGATVNVKKSDIKGIE